MSGAAGGRQGGREEEGESLWEKGKEGKGENDRWGWERGFIVMRI